MPTEALGFRFNYDEWYAQISAQQRRKARLYTLRRSDGTIEEAGDASDIVRRREETTRAGIERAEQQWRHYTWAMARQGAPGTAAEGGTAAAAAPTPEESAAHVPVRVDGGVAAAAGRSALCTEWADAIAEFEVKTRGDLVRHEAAAFHSLAERAAKRMLLLQHLRRQPGGTSNEEQRRQQRVELAGSEDAQRAALVFAEQRHRAVVATGMSSYFPHGQSPGVVAGASRRDAALRWARLCEELAQGEAARRVDTERAEAAFRDQLARAHDITVARRRVAATNAARLKADGAIARSEALLSEERLLRQAIEGAARGQLAQLLDACHVTVVRACHRDAQQVPPPLPQEEFDALMQQQAAGRSAIRHAATAWFKNMLINHETVVVECAALEEQQRALRQRFAGPTAVSVLLLAETSARRAIEAASVKWGAHHGASEVMEALTAPIRYARATDDGSTGRSDPLLVALCLQIDGKERRARLAVIESEVQWRGHLRRRARQERAGLVVDVAGIARQMHSEEGIQRTQVVQAEERWRVHLVARFAPRGLCDP